jgi:uncharacterized OB-fold protein
VSEPSVPVPVPDETSAPFWEAAAGGVLALARCETCHGFSHPPAPICPHCHATDAMFTFTPVATRGAVRSWTVVRQSSLQGLENEVPFVLVDVAIEGLDDLRLIGRLVDGVDAPLSVGAVVDVVFEQVADRVALPAFTLAGT